MSDQLRYNRVAMAIHWLTAVTILGLLVVGNIMADMPNSPLRFQLYNLHKSFGITILLLTLFRLVWRLINPPPPLPMQMPAWEVKAAHITHWLFYGLLIGVPIIGWMMVSASPRNIPTVLFGLISWPHLPFLPDLDLQTKKDLKDAFETAHATVAYLMAGLVILHIGAALRHRLILKDKVTQRMLPNIIPVLLLALFAMPAGAADWQVDSGKSTLGFVGNFSGQKFDGHFKSWQAEISFDPAQPAAGHAKIQIDMTSAVTGDRQRDQALPDNDWFNAKKVPQAQFEAVSFTAKGGNAYEATGQLTIRGVTKPVTLPFTLDIAGDQAHAKGQLEIIRTDYGVGQGEWADGSMVGLQVTIVFEVTALRH
jgi:cytochrome b561/polyisoprenoid-binding protein YceI